MDGGRGDRFRTRWERDAQCSPVQPLSAMGPFPAKSSKTAPVGSGSRVQTNPHKLKTLRALAPVSGSVQPLGPSQVWREGGSVQCAVCSPGKLTRELCVRRSWCARGHTHLFVHTHIWIGFGRRMAQECSAARESIQQHYIPKRRIGQIKDPAHEPLYDLASRPSQGKSSHMPICMGKSPSKISKQEPMQKATTPVGIIQTFTIITLASAKLGAKSVHEDQ